ncbi:hypothetical protein [Flavisolibacter tropicus]|uniref:Uncharacterized protein n=1 Tax=Flavisolibacter tropicus TaxID=1492898 RepID=A0A172TZF9_9BACT|nr:hypothetical protein [Flavisolibacter tropicus]ANE52163.1 hypothetical protein SY85_18355 [Flavisolibacter tropicus]
MELDSIKQNWDAMSNQLKDQNLLNTQLIDQMTQAKFKSKLKRVTYPEMIGIVICLAGAVFIGVNFDKLATPFFKSVGALSILLILSISLISFKSIQQFAIIGDTNKTYKETLTDFMVNKLKFYKWQRVNFLLCHLLLVVTLILISAFFSTSITDSKYFWIISLPLAYIFLSFYSRWVLKNYNRILGQTEDILREIQL